MEISASPGACCLPYASVSASGSRLHLPFLHLQTPAIYSAPPARGRRCVACVVACVRACVRACVHVLHRPECGYMPVRGSEQKWPSVHLWPPPPLPPLPLGGSPLLPLADHSPLLQHLRYRHPPARYPHPSPLLKAPYTSYTSSINIIITTAPIAITFCCRATRCSPINPPATLPLLLPSP